MNIIAISKQYKTRPSEILGIADPYTAFCLDEACIFIETKIKDMKENEIDKLNFIENEKDKKEEKKFAKRYKAYSELVKEVVSG